jgi:hypothetical protein
MDLFLRINYRRIVQYVRDVVRGPELLGCEDSRDVHRGDEPGHLLCDPEHICVRQWPADYNLRRIEDHPLVVVRPAAESQARQQSHTISNMDTRG